MTDKSDLDCPYQIDRAEKWADELAENIKLSPGMLYPCEYPERIIFTKKIEIDQPDKAQKYNANGWPQGGIYMGAYPDEKGILLYPPALKESVLRLIEPLHQQRKVYQDELDEFNGGYYRYVFQDGKLTIDIKQRVRKD